jgi:cell division protein FtsQ
MKMDLYQNTQTDIYRDYDTDYDTTRQSGGDSAVVRKNEKKRSKKRSKRRKKHYFLRFLIFVAIAAAVYIFLTSSVFSIDRIVIEGNTLISDDEIIEMSGVSEGDNMFKATNHKVKSVLTENQYIADVKVKRTLPNIYTIVLTERLPVIAIQNNGKYIILDEEGYAVDEADSTMYSTLVTGININSYEIGSIPEFEDGARFKEVSSLITDVNNSGMFFKKVELETSLTVKCYITDTLICSGESDVIVSEIESIKAVLYDLNEKGVKRGIIKVGADNYISFSPVTE